MLDLKKHELFKNFSDNILSKLSQYVFEKDYEENEIIFKEGDPGDSLCIVEQGEVAIRRLVDKNQTKRKTLAIIEKGDFFGEMAIFEGKPRSASAVASLKTKILFIKKEDFWNLLKEEPDTAVTNLLAINRAMSERLRVANQNFITTFEVGQIISAVNDMQSLFEQVLEQLAYSMEKADAIFFALYNEFTETFMIVSKKGEEASKIREEELTKEDSVIKDIIQNKKAIYIENIDMTEEYPDLVHKIFDGKSVIIAPVFLSEKLLGVLFVVCFKEYDAFNQTNKLLAGTVARQLAPAIEDLKHRQEEENRKRLQEKRYNY
jgi:CRP-like cAMP-binding protein